MPKIALRQEQDLSNRAHRLLIGYLGLFMPVLIYIMASVRPTVGLEPWRLLDSVSAYYYTRAVGVFAGMLFALALFLFSYRGYQGEWADKVLGKIAGLAALGVPLFPTDPVLPSLQPSWWKPFMGKVHFASAAVLFCCFIVFALWLFRKTSVSGNRRWETEKVVRNAIFIACGFAMVGSMVWAFISHLSNGHIFWPEAVAIEAFAISWLAKGQAHLSFVRPGQSIVHLL
jgi:hypothetical protein